MDIYRLLRVLAIHDVCDSVFWREDLTFWVNCNDFFAWAVSDAIEIKTDEDIDLLEQSIKDCSHDGPAGTGSGEGPLLYCARKVESRPQGAYYKSLDVPNWPLFDKCGPERDINFFNPQDQQGNHKYKKEEQ